MNFFFFDVNHFKIFIEFPDGSADKGSACNTRDTDLIPGSGRSSGEGNSNPLQYSCLGNPVDRGGWQATAQRVSKSQT